MSKVLLLLHLCEKSGIELRNKRIFDYGFGAGTFLRHCPSSSKLAGVEIDPQNVAAVQAMLDERGQAADLQAISMDDWAEHPLLREQHDVIVLSHVLEHLPDPASFLRTVAASLAPGGVVAGLVPLNERVLDPHHVQSVDRARVFAWAELGGMHVQTYFEADPWLYWFQPIFSKTGAIPRLAAQGVSLATGAIATAFPPRLWFGSIARLFAAITGSAPTQAAFVLAPLCAAE